MITINVKRRYYHAKWVKGEGVRQKVFSPIQQTQLAPVMAAKQRDVCIGLQRKRTQPLLIVTPGSAVAAHHPLVEAQPWRAVPLRMAHLFTIEPGVAAVQQPAIALAHSDSRMSQRVSG